MLKMHAILKPNFSQTTVCSCVIGIERSIIKHSFVKQTVCDITFVAKW